MLLVKRSGPSTKPFEIPDEAETIADEYDPT